MNRRRIVVFAATAAVALAGSAVIATVASASGTGRSGTVYVSQHGRAGARDANCGSAAYNSVTAAVSAAPAGGTVQVCGGTYRQSVTVAKRVSLRALRGTVIDATGQITGILVTADHVTVSGFTVTNAIGEGILVNSANNATIEGNVVKHNDLGAAPVDPVATTYPECQAQGGVPGDCGEGIHLMGSSHSTVAGNVSTDNSGGILLTDETGPASHNRIAGNVVANNLTACGITVVSHSPNGAPGGVPAPQAGGTYANDVVANTISGNGRQGAGAGVVLATGLPGGAVYDNTVEQNSITGNGMSGVTVHSHVPGQYLNGNVVRHNIIGVNNLNGDPDFAPAVDDRTTGVLVATVAPLSITVSDNSIIDDHFGVWTTGPSTAEGAHDNRFVNVTVPVAAN